MKYIIRIFIIISFIFLLSGCYNKIWKYNFSNNYQIRNDSKMITKVGLVLDNKFYINYKGKKVGVDDYIAEYQYSDNFIGLRCVKNDTLEVIYYIIDTKNRDVYGFYNELDIYNEVKNRITNNEKFTKFIAVPISNK